MTAKRQRRKIRTAWYLNKLTNYPFRVPVGSVVEARMLKANHPDVRGAQYVKITDKKAKELLGEVTEAEQVEIVVDDEGMDDSTE